MKEYLLKIINTYGVMDQLKYFQSEVFELNEAIITHELKNTVEYEIPLTEIIGTKEHIENLKKFGKCSIHRESFIKNFVS